MKIDGRLKVVDYNLRCLAEGKALVIHQGGKGSRKTYGNLDTIIALAMCKHRNGNKVFSVVSETMPHLKRGAMRDFDNLLRQYELYPYVGLNKTESTYKIFDNSIEFFSADRTDKVRGPRRDYLFVNECNNIPFEVFDHLMGRTRIATLCDFNPVKEFYIHTEILARKELYDCGFMVSTFLDNPYLPEGELRDLKIKQQLAKTSEYWANWWKIYGEGKIGIMGGVIFPNWEQIDRWPDILDFEKYGMDFGFTNHPTTLTKVGVHRNTLYLDELIYETGLTSGAIIKRLQQLEIKKRYDEIFGDRADPKTIEEIHLAGYNIKGAESESIIAGLDKIHNFDAILVTKRSLNLIKELRNYCWVRDKDGRYTNKPIDGYNHAIDSVRYALSKRVLRTLSKDKASMFH